ncbi:MAG: AAA family ATPase [Saprospiraceae bacterium]
MKKDTPIGYSDFKKIMEENRYYVDKTALVSSVMKSGEVVLLCRPRRFGKSLNLSMLRYFFDKSQSYAPLFEGLAVQQDADMMRHQGQYPVIMLTFKNARANHFADALEDLCGTLRDEWRRHDYLAGNPEYDSQLAKMNASLDSPGQLHAGVFVQSVRQLSELLNKHFSAPTVVLIDEYDTPVQNGWLKGYYDDMVDFLRKLLGSALKDNPHLKKGVLTGILRVSKESLFSDLNNFKASSGIVPDAFCDKFGFTETEVQAMLRHYDLNGREMADINSWYNGYRFGGTTIFNPWSIINFVDSEDRVLRPYWVNTSGNELLKRLFFAKSNDIRPLLERLVRSEKITVRLSEHLVFKELEENEIAVLNLLYFSGYLRAENPQPEGDFTTFDLSIPNREIRSAYQETVLSWLRSDLRDDLKDPMLNALLTGDVLTFEEFLSDFVVRVFSFYDAEKNRPEHFYHAFLLGLLVRLDVRYRIRSNIESGFGRYDICLIPRDAAQKGVVMEIKAPNLRRNETLEQALEEAEKQVFRQKYATELADLGVTDVLHLAIAVCGKEVRVKEAVPPVG